MKTGAMITFGYSIPMSILYASKMAKHYNKKSETYNFILNNFKGWSLITSSTLMLYGVLNNSLSKWSLVGFVGALICNINSVKFYNITPQNNSSSYTNKTSTNNTRYNNDNNECKYSLEGIPSSKNLETLMGFES